MNAIETIRATIRDVPDFPIKGIVFKDITTVLHNSATFRMAVDLFAEHHRHDRIDRIAAIDARGFFFGAALAYTMGCGLVPIRKKGKLPYRCVEAAYELEYGQATVEMHEDAVRPGENVLLIDDLLATGGTAAAGISLIEKLGGVVVSADFLVELSFLRGRDKIGGCPVFAPIVYDAE